MEPRVHLGEHVSVMKAPEHRSSVRVRGPAGGARVTGPEAISAQGQCKMISHKVPGSCRRTCHGLGPCQRKHGPGPTMMHARHAATWGLKTKATAKNLQNDKLGRPQRQDWEEGEANDEAGESSEVEGTEDHQAVPSTHCEA
jgi:hypothetical protein